MYIVEDQELDNKQNYFMFGKQQQAEWRFELKTMRLQVTLSIRSATHQLFRFYE